MEAKFTKINDQWRKDWLQLTAAERFEKRLKSNTERAEEFYGKLDTFESLRGSSSSNTILLMLITSGLSHLPPIKVVTILSGAAAVNLWVLIGSAIVARGARFLFLAWLLKKYGAPIQEFVEKRLGLIAGAACAAVLALYFAAKYFL
jgi:hypothetical protein